MNSDQQRVTGTLWADAFAISLQEWRAEGKLGGGYPLFRIDYRNEAAQAPMQFDPVGGRLHRSRCSAIPESSRSALFARWSLAPDERPLACPICQPEPPADETLERKLSVDLFYGVISILDQFGNILRERGREFRNSQEGRDLEKQLEGLYATLDKQQREALEVLLSALGKMVDLLQECDKNLHEGARMNGNGKPMNGSRRGTRLRSSEQVSRPESARKSKSRR